MNTEIIIQHSPDNANPYFVVKLWDSRYDLLFQAYEAELLTYLWTNCNDWVPVRNVGVAIFGQYNPLNSQRIAQIVPKIIEQFLTREDLIIGEPQHRPGLMIYKETTKDGKFEEWRFIAHSNAFALQRKRGFLRIDYTHPAPPPIPPTSGLNEPQFKALDFNDQLSSLSQDFIGREWLVEEIEDFLVSTTERHLIIEGETGVGKSAFAAHLISTGKIHAYHFCRFGDPEKRLQRPFVESMRAQLESARILHPLSLLPASDTLNTRQHIDHYYAFDEDEYSFLEHVLLTPLRMWANQNPDAQLVFLVDALDEARLPSGENNIVALLEQMDGLPPQIKWILTGRPDSVDLSGTRIPIADNAQEYLKDVRRYIEKCLDESPFTEAFVRQPTERTKLITALNTKARGNFLYLTYVLKQIREILGQGLPLPTPADLPKDLDDIYWRFLKRLGTGFWENSLHPVLAALTVAREPLEIEQLAAFSGKTQSKTRECLYHHGVIQFLSSATPPFQLFHASFRDFLFDDKRSKRFAVSAREANRQVGNALLDEWRQPDNASPYCIEHLPAHLNDGGQQLELEKILCDYNWIQKRMAKKDGFPALIASYELAVNQDIAVVGSALKHAQPILEQIPNQLPVQLWARLCGYKNKPIRDLLYQAKVEAQSPWFQAMWPCLSDAQGALMRIMRGHTKCVTSVVLNAEADIVISGSDDNSVRLWNLKSGICIDALTGHTDDVSSVAITADGKFILSGSIDNTLRFWNVESRKCLEVLEGHTDFVTSVAITPDGRFALSGSRDQTLRLWKLESGKCVKILRGHSKWVNAVAITPDGSKAISASDDGPLRIWDLDSGECLHTLEGHSEPVRDVVLTSDGKFALSGSNDASLRYWSVDSGQCLKVFTGHHGWVRSVDLNVEAGIAISGSDDKSVRLWNLKSGVCTRIFWGHSWWVRSVVLSPDGKFGVSGSDDLTIRQWNLENALNPTTRDNLAIREKHESEVTSVAITQDGRFALSGSRDRTLRLWKLESGKCVKILRGHSKWVNAVAITPDGSKAISASDDGPLRIWDLDSGECLHILEGHTDAVRGLALTPDGKFALSGSFDGSLRYWSMDSGKCLYIAGQHSASVLCVAVAADGITALAGYDDSTARYWEVESGKCLQILEGHGNYVRSVALTPDNRHALCGSSDFTLRIWNLESGHLDVLPHGSHVTAVAVSMEGNTIVSGSDDYTLRLWDTERDGYSIATSINVDSFITSCAISANNKVVFGASDTVGFLQIQY